MHDWFWAPSHFAPFITKALHSEAGGDLVDAMDLVKAQAALIWSGKPINGANHDFKTIRQQVVRGHTAIDVVYDRSRSSVIDIRLMNSNGETSALFTENGIVIQKLPDSVLPALTGEPVSRVVDLASYAKSGFGHEIMLDDIIRKASKRFGTQTILKIEESNGSGIQKIICAEAKLIWENSKFFEQK